MFKKTFTAALVALSFGAAIVAMASPASACGYSYSYGHDDHSYSYSYGYGHDDHSSSYGGY